MENNLHKQLNEEKPNSETKKNSLTGYLSDIFKSKSKDKKTKFPRREPVWMYRNE